MMKIMEWEREVGSKSRMPTVLLNKINHVLGRETKGKQSCGLMGRGKN
jgi:hypothetical protein